MNKAAIPVAIAGVLMSVTFVVGKRVLRANLKGTPTVAVDESVVYASAKELPAGYKLTAEDLTTIEMPSNLIAATMFSDPAKLEGRVLMAPLEAGQVIREAGLASEEAVAALQAKVPVGMRAVTVSINDVSGLAGLITPGVRVDLVSTLVDGVTNETFARTIVQNVLVQAVGKNLTEGNYQNLKDAPKATTVTLLVTPSQAEAIDLAFTKSKPRLVLRGGGDNDTVEEPGVTMAELAGRSSRNDRLNESPAGEMERDNRVMEMLASLREDFDAAQKRQEQQQASPAASSAVAGNASQAQTAVEGDGPQIHRVRVIRGLDVQEQSFTAESPKPAESSGLEQASAETNVDL